MSYLSLSSKPTRAELREAIRALKPLAKCGVSEAQAELAAVEALASDLYPRKVTPGAVEARGKSPKKKRRRRAIEPCDVMCPCPTCRGRGIVDWFLPLIGRPFNTYSRVSTGEAFVFRARRTTWRLLPRYGHELAFARALPTFILNTKAADYRLVDHVERHFTVDRTCRQCAGKGKVVGGTVQYTIEFGMARWRERFDPRCNQLPPMTPVPVRTYRHGRGSLLGRMIGKPTLAEMRARRSFRCRNSIGGAGCGGNNRPVTPHDLAAYMESRAILIASNECQMKKPRNAKKMGSARDKRNLKPGQQRRSKMDRRAQVWQSIFNAQARREAGVYRCRVPAHKSAEGILAQLGIDVPGLAVAMESSPPMVVLDDPIIAEARRRGDLPVLEPAPDERMEPVLTSFERRKQLERAAFSPSLE